MANVPSDLKYAKTHEWVRVSGNVATVGITDHAQHELTDVVFVELPEVGRQIKAGDACAVVESVKTANDIYSPGQRRGHRSQQPGRRRPGPGEQRTLRRGLVLQDQALQPGRTECATHPAAVPGPNRRHLTAADW